MDSEKILELLRSDKLSVEARAALLKKFQFLYSKKTSKEGSGSLLADTMKEMCNAKRI